MNFPGVLPSFPGVINPSGVVESIRSDGDIGGCPPSVSLESSCDGNDPSSGDRILFKMGKISPFPNIFDPY
jgi:hypothetical protein